MEPITIVALLGGASTFTMFAALVRQTMRAERAVAALAKIEATVAECGSALVAYVEEPIYRLGEARPIGSRSVLAPIESRTITSDMLVRHEPPSINERTVEGIKPVKLPADVYDFRHEVSCNGILNADLPPILHFRWMIAGKGFAHALSLPDAALVVEDHPNIDLYWAKLFASSRAKVSA